MNDFVLVVVTLAALCVGALLGYLVAQLRASRRIEAVRIELEAARVRLESLSRLDADRIALLEQSETRLRGALDSLAGETLRSNSETFLKIARETLGRDQAIAQSSLKERETAIAQLVEPIRLALQKTEAQVESLERERRDAFSSLRTQIETLANGQTQLQRETRNLVTALRRPEVRGRWGELTLRRLVELAGMAEHCDFTEQVQVVSDEGALQPDMVVHMPECAGPGDRRQDAPRCLPRGARGGHRRGAAAGAAQAHAQQVETRVRELASQELLDAVRAQPRVRGAVPAGRSVPVAPRSPSGPSCSRARSRRASLSPRPRRSIALLKTVAYGWRQSAVAQNAAQIRDLGQELYRRLSSFHGHLGRMGQRLGAAVEAYNAAVGSLERQVLPQARRFPELGVTADAPLAPPEPVGQLVRGSGAPGGADVLAVAPPPETHGRSG